MDRVDNFGQVNAQLAPKLDDPTFLAAIYTALFEREGGSYGLVSESRKSTII
ncbi:hypothetical protein CES86_5282 [Brucella lupini]|uniref:Uncharacterized protein n=1 Tax=Brucella lupini TaxID=255457 RepID=A0A256H0H3_9HYPH|nr:hypothetical protein CES86_5282 [Brucella lupini]